MTTCLLIVGVWLVAFIIALAFLVGCAKQNRRIEDVRERRHRRDWDW